MRLMMVGQKWLAAEVLQAVIQAGHDVVATFTPDADDRLHRMATGLGIQASVEPHRLDAPLIPPDVDLIVCAHAHCFVTDAARAATTYGAIGYHPSLLPRHRGRDAIRWAIHMREAVTGGTVYWLDNGADTGPIAAQDWCHIRPDDTAESLWRRDLAPMGVRLLARVVGQIEAGEAQRKPQEEALATWEPAFRRAALSAG